MGLGSRSLPLFAVTFVLMLGRNLTIVLGAGLDDGLLMVRVILVGKV